MTETKRYIPLRVERMSDGGFVVSETSIFGGSDPHYRGPLFASTTIGEALAFIAGRLDPEAAKPVAALPVECWRCGRPAVGGLQRNCANCGA